MSDFTSNDLNGLMEAYLEIYESPETAESRARDRAAVAQANAELLANQRYKSSSDGKLYRNYNDALAARNSRVASLGMQQNMNRSFRAGGGLAALGQGRDFSTIMRQGTTNLQGQQRPTSSPSGGASPRQAPSSVVLAKQGGVEGRLDKATGKFTAGAFSSADTARYAKFSPSTSASTGTSPTAPAPTTTAARPPIASPTAPAPTTTAVRPPIAPVTPNRAITAAPSSSPTASGSVVPVTNRIAASPTPIPTTTSNIKKPLNQSFDIFDIIKGHLLDEGYADTEEAALAIMTNMSEDWRESIVEGYQTVSDNAAEAMRRREASLRPGAYPGQDTTDNWRKSIKMRDGLYKTGVTPI